MKELFNELQSIQNDFEEMIHDISQEIAFLDNQMFDLARKNERQQIQILTDVCDRAC